MTLTRSLPLQVDCSDHDSDGSHDLIGSFTTTVSQLQKSVHGSPVSSLKVTGITCHHGVALVRSHCPSLCFSQVQFDCIHPEKQKKKKSYKNSGVVSVKNCKVENRAAASHYFC